MNRNEDHLTVVRARFSLDVCEPDIDKIIASFRSISSGKMRIEVYRQIALTRDIKWLIFTSKKSFPDMDLFCDRLISALSEYCCVDRTDWHII